MIQLMERVIGGQVIVKPKKGKRTVHKKIDSDQQEKLKNLPRSFGQILMKAFPRSCTLARTVGIGRKNDETREIVIYILL